MTLMLSIIIPTLNEERYLPKLLKSIKNQDFKDYEIIVADYNSRDNTRKVAKRFCCRITQGGGLATGRNNGAKIAKSNLLLFLDADVILPRNFLKRTVRTFRKKGLVAATCFAVPDSNNPLDHALFLSWNIFMWIFQFFDPHASGYCIFTKKEVHDYINGFDETLSVNEDLNYVKRISKFGKFRIITPGIIVSVRRFEKEGRFRTYLKYTYAVFYRMFKGEVRKKIIKFEFGKHS